MELSVIVVCPLFCFDSIYYLVHSLYPIADCCSLSESSDYVNPKHSALNKKSNDHKLLSIRGMSSRTKGELYSMKVRAKRIRPLLY